MCQRADWRQTTKSFAFDAFGAKEGGEAPQSTDQMDISRILEFGFDLSFDAELFDWFGDHLGLTFWGHSKHRPIASPTPPTN